MAGSSGAIRAGRAYVELFSDDSKLSRGLTIASKKLQAWGKGISSVGTAVAASGLFDIAKGVIGITALGAAAKVFSDVGDQLDKMSIRTGISVEALSALKFAAEQSGTSLEEVEGAVRKMQKALAGSDPAFAKLGLSAKALTQLAPDEALGRIADRMAMVANPTKRAALAMEIFGKTGTQLLPLLSGGAKGLRALQQEAEEAGLIMSRDDAAAAAKLNDAIGKLKSQFMRIVAVIGSAVAPVLLDLMKRATPIIKQVIDWTKANSGLIVSVLKISAALIAFGAGQVALGGVLKIVGIGVSLLGSALGVVVPVLGAVLAGVTALFSPLGLVAAAVAGLGAAFILGSEQGAATVGTFRKAFNDIRESGLQAWGGIVDAVMSGDLTLAAKIAWQGIKTIFAEGWGSLQIGWLEFKDFFLGVWQSAVYGIAGFFSDAWGTIQATWASGLGMLETGWVALTTSLKLAWLNFTTYLRAAWLEVQKLFTTSEAAKKAEAELVNYTKLKKQQIVGEGGAALANTEQERAKRMQAVLDEVAARRIGLQQMQAEEAQARAADKDSRIKGIQDGIQEEKDALQMLTEEAAAKRQEQLDRAAAGAGQASKMTGGALGGDGGAVAGAQTASSALRLSGQTPWQQFAKTQEEIRDALLDILSEQRNNGGGFALG